jgi:hypothetical protein
MSDATMGHAPCFAANGPNLGEAGDTDTHLSEIQGAISAGLQSKRHPALTDLRASTLRTERRHRGSYARHCSPYAIASIPDAAASALLSFRFNMEDLGVFHSLAATFADRELVEHRRGDWRAAFVVGFNAFMQVTQLLAVYGAGGFDTRWNELWNSIRNITASVH